MKKFFIVLLSIVVFSEWVFAEGKVSFSGEAELGATILFPKGEQLPGAAWDFYYRAPPATISRDKLFGDFTVNYDNELENGTFHGELTFRGELRNQRDNTYDDKYESVSAIKWLASYEADVYKIAVGLKSSENSFTDFDIHSDNFSYLYGWFYFWDKQIKFDLAYKGYDAVDEKYSYSEDLPLASDVVATWDLDMESYARLLPWWGNFEGIDGARLTYKPNFLDGLIVRLAWRDLFNFAEVPLDFLSPEEQLDYGQYTLGQYLATFTLFTRFDMVSLFDIPLAFSFGYANRTYRALHAGASYKITDTLTVMGDVKLSGLLKIRKYGIMAYGANVDYSSAPLYANMYIRLGADLSDGPNKGNGSLQFEPVVKYAIIPNTFLVKFGVLVGMGIGNNYKPRQNFCLSPGLYWNIKADGDTDEPACGIRLNYKYGILKYNKVPIEGPNDLTLSFHWSF
jgi:hypothetical protein